MLENGYQMQKMPKGEHIFCIIILGLLNVKELIGLFLCTVVLEILDASLHFFFNLFCCLLAFFASL